MPKLKFDEDGKRFYETGVSECILFVKDENGYADGVAWNGITAITESPSGAEPTAIYADNMKYLNLLSAEEFAATVEAYTYPDEFAECDGSAVVATGVSIGQQARKTFALVYKTCVGNDEEYADHAYKLHIIYNCLAAPSEKGYATINDSPEAITFSWELSTTPVKLEGHKPSATIVIDSRTANETKLTALIDKLYGTDGQGSGTGTDPELPDLATVISMMSGT